MLKYVDTVISRYSKVKDSAFFRSELFDWTASLEANWRAIRDELKDVMTQPEQLPNFQDVSRDQRRISRDDRWKTFFLYGYGYRMDSNCVRCPETARLVAEVPGMKTAFFSILMPGKHIPAHRGPYKGVIRYHLALVVPEAAERCRIRVGDQTAFWQKGRSLMFDDTYEHEVWNDTQELRAVLFLDVERPLRFPGSLVNKLAFSLIRLSPYVQNARRNAMRWQSSQKSAINGPSR